MAPKGTLQQLSNQLSVDIKNARAAQQRATAAAKRATPPKPRPKKKPKPPQPKKEGEPRVRAARRIHLMSPYNDQLIPAMIATGSAIAYRANYTTPFKQQTNQHVIIIVTNFGDSAAAIFFLTRTTVSTVTSVAAYVSNYPAITSTEVSGGPVEGRAMKSGIRVVNNTPVANRGGAVTYLNTSSKILTPVATVGLLGTNNYDDIFNNIIATEGNVPMDASQFGLPQTFSSAIADSTDYHTFRPWLGAFSEQAAWARFSAGTTPLSYQILCFAPPVWEQTYTLSLKNTYYLRYPLGSMQAGLHRPIPVASGPVVNALHSVGAAMARTAQGAYEFATSEAGMLIGHVARSAAFGQ
jgi:hypothetical protein